MLLNLYRLLKQGFCAQFISELKEAVTGFCHISSIKRLTLSCLTKEFPCLIEFIVLSRGTTEVVHSNQGSIRRDKQPVAGRSSSLFR